MPRSLLMLGIVVVWGLSGCAGIEGGGSVFDDPSCESYYYPFANGHTAYSPDGKYYAQEGTTGVGGVVVYTRTTNSVVLSINTGDSELKALAWSRDSKMLATMYHGGPADGCDLWSAADGTSIAHIGPGSGGGFYHSIVFSSDDKWVLVAYRGDSGFVDARFAVPPGAP